MPRNRLFVACEACDRALGPAECRLTYETPGGERRAYECACGAVTITVARQAADGDANAARERDVNRGA